LGVPSLCCGGITDASDDGWDAAAGAVTILEWAARRKEFVHG
jgi:hypothetical protein